MLNKIKKIITQTALDTEVRRSKLEQLTREQAEEMSKSDLLSLAWTEFHTEINPLKRREDIVEQVLNLSSKGIG